MGSIARAENYYLIAGHLNAKRLKFKENFEPFNKLVVFMEILDGLIGLKCKTTCKEAGSCAIGGENHTCDAVKCVHEKSYEGCWERSENENCEKLNFVKNVYGEVRSETMKS